MIPLFKSRTENTIKCWFISQLRKSILNMPKEIKVNIIVNLEYPMIENNMIV